MPIGIHPDASERIEIVFTSDPAVAEANSAEDLLAYIKHGDLNKIRVPVGATRAWIAPLSISARNRMAGFVQSIPGPDASEGATLEYNGVCVFATCVVGLREIDALPDIKAAAVGRVLEFPLKYLERLPFDVLLEVSAHVHRISRLPQSTEVAGTNMLGKDEGSSETTPEA